VRIPDNPERNKRRPVQKVGAVDNSCPQSQTPIPFSQMQRSQEPDLRVNAENLTYRVDSVKTADTLPDLNGAP
jgi:hypothetical protein